jgi:hypothetical protein
MRLLFTYLLVVVLALLFLLPAQCADQPDRAPTPDTDTITVSRDDFEAMKARLDQLEKEVAELKQHTAVATTPAPSPGEAGTASEAAPASGSPGGGKYLALPDISFVAQAVGKITSDRHDEMQNRLRLREAEIGIQGYVYPNVKADAFIAMSPEEDEAAQVEEAYLSYIGVTNGMNLYVGRKHVTFGRTNLLHNHSWPYVEQPLVLRNLVAEESLTGDGLDISYTLPTPGSLFAQLDLGTWTGSGEGETSNLPEVMVGPGASFDRFNTARLWTSYPITENSEFELGSSYAHGQSAEDYAPEGGHATLTGIDATYRHYGAGESRLLLRAEGVTRKEDNDFGTHTAKGYYLFGNLRKDKYASWGLLYDWSEFPQAPDLHESKTSLIWTKQFSEQYYLRVQASHGSRPEAHSYNQILLQWVWGVGPHTHSLE